MPRLSRTVELEGGRRASYDVVGAGEPLLFFQGGPGFSAAPLAENAALLAERFAVHLVDPHGSGRSTPPASDDGYTPEGHARFYDEVRGALGIEQATVAGISFGAITALTYAALHPGVVKRCISVAGAAQGAEVDPEQTAAEMEANLARHAGARWYPQARRAWDAWSETVLATDDPEVVNRLMLDVLPLYFAHPSSEASRRAMQRWAQDLEVDLRAVKVWEAGLYQHIDVRPLLDRIACSTLVIAGELDALCGPAQAAIITSHVVHAEAVTIPDCGHFVPDEAPDAFREAVLSWVDRPEPA